METDISRVRLDTCNLVNFSKLLQCSGGLPVLEGGCPLQQYHQDHMKGRQTKGLTEETSIPRPCLSLEKKKTPFSSLLSYCTRGEKEVGGRKEETEEEERRAERKYRF